MKDQAGFSVFEVLVAFTIMALVLSALLPGLARLLARATSGEDAVLAHDLALSRLATLAVEEPLVAGQSTTEHGTWQSIEIITAGETIDGLTGYNITVRILAVDGREIAHATTLHRASDVQ